MKEALIELLDLLDDPKPEVCRYFSRKVMIRFVRAPLTALLVYPNQPNSQTS